MDKRLIDVHVSIPTRQDAPEASEPAYGTFDFPSLPVTTQGATVLGLGLHSALPVRANEFDAPPRQAFAERVAVIGPIGYDPVRFLARVARFAVPDLDGAQRFFRERDFRRTYRALSLGVVQLTGARHSHF